MNEVDRQPVVSAIEYGKGTASPREALIGNSENLFGHRNRTAR